MGVCTVGDQGARGLLKSISRAYLGLICLDVVRDEEEPSKRLHIHGPHVAAEVDVGPETLLDDRPLSCENCGVDGGWLEEDPEEPPWPPFLLLVVQ